MLVGMPRLDPAHPPLWRSPDTLQFGQDARVVIAMALPWHERVVSALEAGATDAELTGIADAIGIARDQLREFLARLRPVLRDDDAAARRPVTVLDQTRLTAPARGGLIQALADGGFTALDPRGPGSVAAGRLPVVVVAAHVLDPRLVSHLMSADVAHVPIVVAGGRLEVGPVVLPGRTACLMCIQSARRDRDPDWPAVAAQLLGRPSPAVAPTRAAEAGAVAARLLRDALDVSGRARTRSLTLHDGALHRRSRWHRPHAQCGCRSLAGSATADARADRAPTSATASGPRA